MLRKVEAKGVAYTATRIREMCGQIFRYGVATGRAEDNPAAHLVGALASQALHTASPSQSGANSWFSCVICEPLADSIPLPAMQPISPC